MIKSGRAGADVATLACGLAQVLALLEEGAEGCDAGARPHQQQRRAKRCRQLHGAALHPHRHLHLPRLRLQPRQPRRAYALCIGEEICGSVHGCSHDRLHTTSLSHQSR